MQKILVMGGSYNPPTIAHKKILQAALDTTQADLGIFVPSSEKYVAKKMRRQEGEGAIVFSEEKRMRMLSAMCASDPRLLVSTAEFGDDGRGHSYETLVKIQENYPDGQLYFIIGADKLRVITHWKNLESFLRDFAFVVIKREDMEPEAVIRRSKILRGYADRFCIVPAPGDSADVSSTRLRQCLKAGDSTAMAELVEPAVLEILLEPDEADQRPEIVSFRGVYAFLSNFYETPVTYQGLTYRNSEAAFQAQKTLDETQRMAFTGMTGSIAKRRGRSLQLRPDWESVKLSTMEDIVRAKFLQNPELAERLLATADRPLIEGNNWHDKFWGVDSRTGQGDNHLGRILMKIRTELAGETQVDSIR